MKKRKIFYVMLMLMSFIFFDGKAKALETYDIWVNGEQFTSEKTEINCGSGTASYDNATSTLTLNNAVISNSYEYKPYNEAMIYSGKDLNIALNGTNTLSSANTAADGIVSAPGKNIRVNGIGNLLIENANYGFYIGSNEMAGGSLTIQLANVKVINPTADGIWVNKDLTVTGGSIIVDTSNSSSNGIVSNSDGIINLMGSILDIKSVKNAIRFVNGDASTKKLKIVYSDVTLTSAEEYGIYFEPNSTNSPSGTIDFSSKYLDITSKKGATNLNKENINVNEEFSYTSGTSLTDPNKVVIEYLPIKEFTVTCILDEENGITKDIMVRYGEVPELKIDSEKEIIGWFTDKELTNEYNNAPVYSDMKLYAKYNELKPIKEVNVTVESPKAGENVTINKDEDGYYIWDTQNPQVRITIPDGANYKLDDGDGEYNYMYWIESFENYDMPFVGRFESGKEYFAEIYFHTNEGYYFDEKTKFIINGKPADYVWNINEKYCDVGVKLKATGYYYEKGQHQTVNTSNNEELSFKLNIDYDKFLESGKVYIDDVFIEPSNYTSSKGSTIITFNQNFTNSLKEGTHNIKVTVDDGEALTDFTITKNHTKLLNPQTGDNILSYITLLIVSALGMSLSVLYKKKYN